MAEWIITRWDGLRVSPERYLPGYLSIREVEVILQHLVCRHLDEDEIISASRRRNDPKRTTFLDRVGRGSPPCYGNNPHYTAEYRE